MARLIRDIEDVQFHIDINTGKERHKNSVVLDMFYGAGRSPARTSRRPAALPKSRKTDRHSESFSGQASVAAP